MLSLLFISELFLLFFFFYGFSPLGIRKTIASPVCKGTSAVYTQIECLKYASPYKSGRPPPILLTTLKVAFHTAPDEAMMGTLKEVSTLLDITNWHLEIELLPVNYQSVMFLEQTTHKINKVINELYVSCQCSLLAEALFLVFADGRKETSAMDRKCLWFNRRPRSWTAALQRMLLAVFADRNLSPLRLAHSLH